MNKDIHERISARSSAINRRDVEASIGDVDADVAIFELIPPLGMIGKRAARRQVVERCATCSEGPHYQDGVIAVEASDDVVFSHVTNRVTKGPATAL